jgi:peptidoglycan/LPS O-acetylase OafA/YrhL
MKKDIIINRSNNFDFLRLLFASLVIVSHSYPLTGQPEIIGFLSSDQLSLGSLSVDCFFIMSGYLIFQSLERSKNIASYLWKRILRLFPALFVLLMITLLIVPFFYRGIDIFRQSSYWSYLPNGLSLYKIQYNIDGVFKTNPYPNAINGSLWSISYEFTLYIVLLIFFPFRKNKYIIRILVIVTFLTLVLTMQLNNLFLTKLFGYFFLNSTLFYNLATFFFAGSLLNFFDLNKYNTLFLRTVLLIIIVLSIFFGYYKISAPFLLPLFILLIATLSTSPINRIGKKIGDISYGVYIYGFLVQQIIMNYMTIKPVQLMLISLPLTFILAYLSWHFVEKKMLKYKNIIS